jgi:hypothetical protein
VTPPPARLAVAGGAVLGLFIFAGAAHFITRAAAEKVRLNRTQISPTQLDSFPPLLAAVPPTAPVQLVEPGIPAPLWEDLTAEPAPSPPGNSPATRWTVSAILISDSRRVAVVNEELVAVGAMLPGGGRLVAIERDHVVIDEPGRGRRVIRVAIDR